MGLFSKAKAAIQAAEERRAQLASAGSLASIQVPGQAHVELPAGRIRLSLEIPSPERTTTRERSAWEQAPKYMAVDVEGPNGAVQVEEDSGFTSADVAGGVRRRTYGTFDVAQAASHTVGVRCDPWYEERGYRLLLDAQPVSE